MSSFVPSYLDEKARAYIQMAQEDRARIVIDANLSVDFHDCSIEVLDYYLIKFGFNFVDWLSEEQKRELLCLLWGRRNGTLGLIANILKIWDQNAKIIEKDLLEDSMWFDFSIILSKLVALTQKKEIEKMIMMMKPVRSRLISFEAQTLLAHDRTFTRNSEITYGGYLNG